MSLPWAPVALWHGGGNGRVTPVHDPLELSRCLAENSLDFVASGIQNATEAIR